MVGVQLGRETDAIAESAYTIEHRLCVMTRASDIIIGLAGKVIRPKLDQPDRRHRLCIRVVVIVVCNCNVNYKFLCNCN